MALVYSKRAMIERVQKHMNNGFPDTDFKTSANEILYYIDEALASQIVGKAYEGAKIEGALVVPEAFYLTSQLPALQQDQATGWWYTTLPQTPISLPLGYSINRMYFAEGQFGASQNVYFIKAKRTAYRDKMPKPNGISAWIEGNKVFMEGNDGQPLGGITPYATMASSRTTDVNVSMNVPDDSLEAIFMSVVNKIKDRLGIPKDVVKDNLPSSNTNINR